MQTSGLGAVSSVIDSTLSSSNGGYVVALGGQGSISDSTIVTAGRGLSVSTGSQLTASNTQVTASSNGAGSFLGGGHGVTVVGGTATIANGSALAGVDHGALLTPDGPATGEPGRIATLTVDDSSLQGQTGSALIIGRTRVDRSAIAMIDLRNGAALTGGNGLAVELVGASAATLTAADTQFNGGILATGASTLDATLLDSRIIGNLQASEQSRLELNAQAGSLSGDINVLDTSTAILAFRNGANLAGSLYAEAGSTASLGLDASTMTGNIAATGATTTVALGDGSTLTGRITNASLLSMRAGSVWNMTQDSQVEALDIDASQINLGGTVGAFRTLTLGRLAGAGAFALNTDIANLQGDKVAVTGEAEGNHVLAVANTGIEPPSGNDGLVLVSTAGVGAAAFALRGGQVDAGTFVYNLAHVGNDWVLVRRGDPIDPVEPGGPDEPGTPGEPGGPVVTPSARAVLGLFSAAPTVWYGELTTWRSRMGDIRASNGISGPWVRAYGGRSNMSAAGGVEYGQQQQGITFGIDTPLPAGDDQWTLGVMAGYSRSNLDLKAGTDGHVDSYYAGLYSTWLNQSGYYLDAVVKVNRFKNSSDVTMSDGQRAKGDYTNHGVGASVEVGKRITVANDWFIEPYLQGSALWVQGEGYGLDNGMQAHSNNAHSWLGKVGSHVGRTLKLEKGGTVQPYVKLAVAHEFANANRVRVNDNSFNNDLSGNRVELGVGIAAQLASNLQLHADYGYSRGKNIEVPAEVSVGLRYAW
ncbi:hypothetical protein ASF66_16425 [Pseudomonas sp. Leaf129]|nr:hypothetical protein ASF66_16425 [Pseudomonas sp. Leaf129]